MGQMKVAKIKGRGHIPEYIVQLNRSLVAEQFPSDDLQFLVVQRSDKSANINPKVHTRVQVLDDDQSHLSNDEIGLDFTLRYALAVTAGADLEYSEVEGTNQVTITPIENIERKRYRKGINWIIGVRPQVCQVRMGVFPDLENKICRVSSRVVFR